VEPPFDLKDPGLKSSHAALNGRFRIIGLFETLLDRLGKTIERLEDLCLIVTDCLDQLVLLTDELVLQFNSETGNITLEFSPQVSEVTFSCRTVAVIYHNRGLLLMVNLFDQEIQEILELDLGYRTQTFQNEKSPSSRLEGLFNIIPAIT
jgi:hypothetical protein